MDFIKILNLCSFIDTIHEEMEKDSRHNSVYLNSQYSRCWGGGGAWIESHPEIYKWILSPNRIVEFYNMINKREDY